MQQGVGRAALVRADAGFARRRAGAGAEEGRPGELVVEGVVEPRRRCMLLTWWAMTLATGMLDTVVPPTVVAVREAVTVMAALARWEGAEDLAVRKREVGRALQGLGRQGGEDVAEGGHSRSPCLRAFRRS